jgi:hypothetical protein
MIIAGVVAAIWGVKAEQTSLEDIAAPLSAVRRTAGRLGDKLDPGTGAGPARA